jgi:hypothetical protein
MLFQDVTENSGISYTGSSYGAAWGDFNDDGFVDLWVSNHGFSATLYQNQGDETFIDVTLDVFDKRPTGDQHGAAWADFDNDGDLDIIQLIGGDAGTSSLTNPALADQFFTNEDGAFVDRAIDLGLGYIGSRSRTPLWFDYDNDGLLDLFQGAAERPDGKVPATIFRQGDGFTDLRPSLGFDLAASRFGILSDLVGDNTPELLFLNSIEGISIYDSKAIALPRSLRIANITDSILEVNYQGKDFISEDFNGDLLPDLYLTRRGLSNSGFFAQNTQSVNLNLQATKNRQGITFQTDGKITIDLFTFGFAFEEIDPENIFIGASGLNPADLDIKLSPDNDTVTELQLTLDPQDSRIEGLAAFTPGKDEGLYLGYDPTLQEWEISLSTPDQDLVGAIIKSTEDISKITAIDFNNELEPLPDILMLNNGSQLLDSTEGSGINSVRTAGVSSVGGDFDNDMDVDIYIVTANAAGNEPNVLYDNQGDGTFVAVEDLEDAAGSNLGIGESVTTNDYNNDGFLDLFITNGDFPPLLNDDGPYQLLENQGNDNHWLEVDLEGVTSNRDGIGAKVLVTAGGVTQLRQQSGGMHDKTQNDSRLHFGLAENTTIESIQVQWSSGIVQTLENIEADQILNITESGNSTTALNTDFAEL